MLQEPLVSVVMPTYNRVSMLGRAVQSVLSQTYKNWELLIVDDASTDGTVKLLNNFSSLDQRVKYYCLETNSGACIARNVGIREAQGEYITFLDSDDEYLVEKIELQVNCFRDSKVPNLGVVSCGREDFINDRMYFKWVPHLKGDILGKLLRKERIGAGTPFLMVKKSLLLENEIFFDPEMPAGQDWDFLVRVCQFSNFDSVAVPLVRVHHHEGERVYNSERALLAISKQYTKYRHLLDDASTHDNFVTKMAVQHFVYGNRKKALEILQKNVLEQSIRSFFWMNYFKIFRNSTSLLSRAILKTLSKLSFR